MDWAQMVSSLSQNPDGIGLELTELELLIALVVFQQL